MKRSFWVVIYFFNFRADSYFFNKFNRRLEVVLEDAEFVFVYLVDSVNNNLGVIAEISENLADASPVLLFDMSVIIFFVRPGASKVDVV